MRYDNCMTAVISSVPLRTLRCCTSDIQNCNLQKFPGLYNSQTLTLRKLFTYLNPSNIYHYYNKRTNLKRYQKAREYNSPYSGFKKPNQTIFCKSIDFVRKSKLQKCFKTSACRSSID